MSQLAVILAGVVAVFFAAMMVMQRSLYACAVCLLAVLLQGSVIFFFCGAPLLAFLQVMIYAGAVMVLIVVTIMAAPLPGPRAVERPSFPWLLALAGLVAPLIEVALVLAQGGLPSGFLGGAFSAQSHVGEILFGPYAVATEAVGLLVFLAALAIADSGNA